MKRLLLIVICLAVAFSSAACTKDNKKTENPADNNKEILDKYDSIADDYYADKPLGENESVLGEGFSLMDFTFTSADNTVSFSLDINSFAKILEGGTYFNSIAPGNEGNVVSYEAGYKTARGLNLANPASEYISKYSIGDDNAIYLDASNGTYYNPRGGAFNGKLTALYGSADGISFKILSSGDVQKYISVRDVFSNNAYIEPAEIMKLFPEYMTLAALNISADETGKVSEVAIYRFDK